MLKISELIKFFEDKTYIMEHNLILLENAEYNKSNSYF